MERQVINGIDFTDISSLQEIPPLFENVVMTGKACVRTSLEIALAKGLIPARSPLRTLWYAFLKLALSKILREVKNGDKEAELVKRDIKNPELTFYLTFAELIRESGLYYRDFHVENSGIVFNTQWTKGFGNSMIFLEKESYFSVFRNFSSLMGVSVYAGGGQPSQSGTEYFFSQLRDQRRLNVLTISDFDPSGIDIANTIYEQLKMYADRTGNNHLECQRIATLPEFYTSGELANALYDVKGETKRRWNTEEMRELRESYDIANNQGLEVESLPADPTPIFPDLFPDYTLVTDWEGQARIRLIVLKTLLDQFGVEKYWERVLKGSFQNSSNASSIVQEKSDYDSLTDVTYEIRELTQDIERNLEELLEEPINETIKELNWWSFGKIAETLDSDDEKHDFTQRLINRVARDTNYINGYRFEIPEEIKDKIEIPEEIKDKMNDIKAKLEEIKQDLQNITDELAEEEG